jgi:hypothetical protein
MIPKPENSCHFTKKPLYLFKINLQSTDFQEAPQILEIIPDIALATSKNYK